MEKLRKYHVKQRWGRGFKEIVLLLVYSTAFCNKSNLPQVYNECDNYRSSVEGRLWIHEIHSIARPWGPDYGVAFVRVLEKYYRSKEARLYYPTEHITL